MRSNITHYIIAGILLFMIYGAFTLSARDYSEGNICPLMLGIPACYLVFAAFMTALLAHIIKPKYRWAFVIILAGPFLLALNGTLTELSGQVVCPRTSGGTPMCFLSLGFCTLLLLLRLTYSNPTKTL